MNQNPKVIGHAFALFTTIVWGTSFIVSKFLMDVVTPIQLMMLRFVLAYVMLWVLHPKWRFQWKEELQFLLIALFANTIYFWTENTALKLTQTSNVSILVTTSPMFVALILWLMKQGEKQTKTQILGYFIGFIGVVFVVLNGALMLQVRPLGDFLALLAALSWAIYGVLIRNMSEKFSSFLITRKLMFYGILTSIPLLLFDDMNFRFSEMFTWTFMSGLLYLSFIASALCYLLWNISIKHLGVIAANVYMYAIPLVTLLAGAMFLNETITWMGIIGIILIIIGMFMSSFFIDKKAKETEEPALP